MASRSKRRWSVRNGSPNGLQRVRFIGFWRAEWLGDFTHHAEDPPLRVSLTQTLSESSPCIPPTLIRIVLTIPKRGSSTWYTDRFRCLQTAVNFLPNAPSLGNGMMRPNFLIAQYCDVARAVVDGLLGSLRDVDG